METRKESHNGPIYTKIIRKYTPPQEVDNVLRLLLHKGIDQSEKRCNATTSMMRLRRRKTNTLLKGERRIATMSTTHPQRL